MRRTLAGSLIALALAGCAVMPDRPTAGIDLPDRWSVAQTGASRIDPAWWTAFGDPDLTALIAEALGANADLAIAAARVAQARAAVGLAAAEDAPSLSLGLNGTRAQTSEQRMGKAAGASNDLRLAATLSYELDLWGRLAAADDAARARLLSSEATRDAVRVTVAAGIASAHFNIKAIEREIEVAERTARLRQRWLEAQRAALRAGTATEVPVRQAESDLAAAQLQIPTLRRQLEQQRGALAVLLGRSPRAMVARADAKPGAVGRTLPAPPAVPLGLPSDLLQRRPDLRAAEMAMKASDADVAAAHAAFFPRITLTGSGGRESDALAALFSGPAAVWNLAAGLTQPLLDGGRNQANLDIAGTKRHEATLQYRQAVRVAFREVLDAVAALRAADERLGLQAVQIKALRRTVAVAEARLAAGDASALDVIDAQRGLFAAELDQVATERDRLLASVDLFKALGGGWSAANKPE